MSSIIRIIRQSALVVNAPILACALLKESQNTLVAVTNHQSYIRIDSSPRAAMLPIDFNSPRIKILHRSVQYNSFNGIDNGQEKAYHLQDYHG